MRGSRGAGQAAVGLVVGAACVVESIVWSHRVEPALTVGGVAAGVALSIRRRFPLASPVAAEVLIFLAALGGGNAYWHSFALPFAAMLAMWAIGRDNPMGPALGGGAVGQACIVACGELAPNWASVNPVAVALLPPACWLAGIIVRRRAESARDLAATAARVEAQREVDLQRAVRHERADIACELHDLVSHTLTIMALQAGGARMLLDSDTERALSAVRTVEAAARGALADLARLEKFLEGHDPGAVAAQPGLAQLPRLLADTTSAGLRIDAELDLALEGRWQGSGVDVIAYRVVQEGLTNALRHGRGTARLRLGQEAGALVVEIVNEVGGTGHGGTGRGLIGLRERVALYGGDIAAGPRGDGTYLLHVRLPTPAS